MTLETEVQLIALRKIGRIVANCLQYMQGEAEPGMTTAELDALGDAYLTKHGARSAPRVTYNFPGATCISINNEVAHGIPGSRRLKRGDLVNIDVSAELGGYFGDTGGSFIVPPESKRKQQLCVATKAALAAGISAARAGRPLNSIGAAIEKVALKTGHSIIRNLGSHGTGRALHEAPSFIPSYYDPRDKRILRENTVMTIEPFLSTGATFADEAEDGWTLFTDPKFLSAQYEHTMVITKGKPIILTMPSAR